MEAENPQKVVNRSQHLHWPLYKLAKKSLPNDLIYWLLLKASKSQQVDSLGEVKQLFLGHRKLAHLLVELRDFLLQSL